MRLFGAIVRQADWNTLEPAAASPASALPRTALPETEWLMAA
jgi:hypothetical protein